MFLWKDEYQFCWSIFGSYAALGGLVNTLTYVVKRASNADATAISSAGTSGIVQSFIPEFSTTSRFTAALWCGVIIGISFTEAWVKFKAPFVKRYLTFDIGRLVFSALNAVEAGLCLTLVVADALHRVGGTKHAGKATDERTGLHPLVASVGVLMLIELFYLTPMLVQKAESLLVDQAVEADVATEETRKRMTELRKRRAEASITNEKGVDEKQKAGKTAIYLHLSYIGIECAKVILLTVYFGQLV